MSYRRNKGDVLDDQGRLNNLYIRDLGDFELTWSIWYFLFASHRALQEHALVEHDYPHCCDNAVLLQELSTLKLQMGACIVIFCDAQRCSDCLRFGMCASFCFPVLVSRLNVRLLGQTSNKVTIFLGHLCPGLAPHATPSRGRW